MERLIFGCSESEEDSMSTKVEGGASPPVLGGEMGRVATAKGRATPKGPGFGAVLATARPILKGAEAVATVLPGGPLVAAAIKAPSTMSGPAYGGVGGVKTGGVAITPRLPIGGTPSGAPAPGGAPDPTGAGATGEQPNMEGVLAESQAFNLYYLQLQEQISAENRSYTTMSNVLKARHDTVKNAIGNIR
jgi:hypothetical protein